MASSSVFPTAVDYLPALASGPAGVAVAAESVQIAEFNRHNDSITAIEQALLSQGGLALPGLTIAGPLATTGVNGTANFSKGLTVQAGGAAITGNSTIAGGLTLTGANNLLTQPGQGLDTAAAGQLTIGTTTATSVLIGQAATNVFVAGTLNAGSGLFNTMSLTGSSTGQPVPLSAIGNDTNVSIKLVPKGTGNVQVASGGLTITAGGLFLAPGQALDTSSAGALFIGSTNATGLQLGSTAFAVTIPGGVTAGADDNLFGIGARTAGTYLDIGSLGDANNGWIDARGTPAAIGIKIRAKGTGVVQLLSNLQVPAAGTIDTSAAGALTIGGTNANAITIGAAAFAAAFPGGLTITAGKAIDTTAAGALNLGTATANAIVIGAASVAPSFPGGLTVTAGKIIDTTAAGALNLGTATANAITIGAAGFAVGFPGGITVAAAKALDTTAAGALNIGPSTATSIVIGSGTIAPSFPGGLTVAAGKIIDTTAAGALNLGTATATSVAIAKAGVTTAIGGPLTVPAAGSFDTAAAGALTIGGTNANALNLGNATSLVNFAYATTALGGGAAPTFGTIGGSGPATAAQNSWLKININGTASFIPVWR